MKNILFITFFNLGVMFQLSAEEPPDGYVVSWGYKYDNQIRTFTNLVEVNGRELSNVVKVLAMPYDSGVGITKDGSFKVWGYLPQIKKFSVGLNDVAGAAISGDDLLVIKSDNSLKGWGPAGSKIPADATNAASVDIGYGPCLVLRKDGRLIRWDRSGRVSEITNIISVSASSVYPNYDLALQSDGTVLQWNVNGFLPELVLGLNHVVSIAVGPAHYLALKADGTVSAWGYNAHGETNVPSGLSHVVKIAAGGARSGGMAGFGFSLALKDDGTISGWGVMGLNNEPLIIPEGLSNVVAIATSSENTCVAVTTNRLVAERFRVRK